MPFVSISEIYGQYLATVDVQMFWILVAAYTALLAVGLPWLANRPQPTPHPEHWEWIEGRTNWKKTVR